MGMKFSIGVCTALLFIAAVAACSTNGRSENRLPPTKVGAPAAPPNIATKQNASAVQPIRSIDFANFTYQQVADLGALEKSFTLRGGELAETRDEKGLVDEMGVSLQSVAYGDVTGDGVEDAMVVLSVLTGGSAIPHVTYLYTLKAGKPQLLWAFSTGDRADGGLRQVYAENGELVIELYGKGKTIGRDLYAEDGMIGGDCCPTHFTLARYQWQGNRFQQKGQEEILPNPVGGAPVVMPRYGSPS